MHKQCSTFKNVLNLRYLFFVMYLIFPKIKVMIIFKHLFVISIPSKTLATSSQYVRKLAIFALLIEGRGITMQCILIIFSVRQCDHHRELKIYHTSFSPHLLNWAYQFSVQFSLMSFLLCS